MNIYLLISSILSKNFCHLMLMRQIISNIITENLQEQFTWKLVRKSIYYESMFSYQYFDVSFLPICKLHHQIYIVKGCFLSNTLSQMETLNSFFTMFLFSSISFFKNENTFSVFEIEFSNFCRCSLLYMTH